MDFSNLELIKLDSLTTIKTFDCGDEDLNDFLFNKAKSYSEELLAVTYILQDSSQTIAYYSIFNDSLRVQQIEFASKNSFKRFISRLVTHPKRHLHYFPALKIGRLGVNNSIKKSGIGKSIVNYIIHLAINQNKTCACKLITVDAYSESLSFYEKLGFTYFSEADKDMDTRQMYLDLTPIIYSLNNQVSDKINF